MERRPRIKIELTRTDKVIEVIGWLALLTIWVLTIASYSNLPDTIPIHYNAAGHIDGFGKKINILGLPLVATIIYVGVTIANRFPHICNYVTKITEENAFRQYTNMTIFNRYLKLIFVLIFGLTEYTIIKRTNSLGIWFIPLTIGLIFIPLTFYIVKSLKTKHL